jgi:hypothetical protein
MAAEASHAVPEYLLLAGRRWRGALRIVKVPDKPDTN